MCAGPNMMMHRVPKVKIKFLDSTMVPMLMDHTFDEFLIVVECGSGPLLCGKDEVDGVFDFIQFLSWSY